MKGRVIMLLDDIIERIQAEQEQYEEPESRDDQAELSTVVELRKTA